MFSQMLSVLSGLADEKLPGWSLRELKYWFSKSGVEYMEVRLKVFDEELWLRLKGHEGTFRIAGVRLYTKSELSEKVSPRVQEEGD